MRIANKQHAALRRREISFPASALDLFISMLLVCIVSMKIAPDFRPEQLPQLRATMKETRAAQTQPPADVLQLVLTAAGEMRLDQQVVRPADVSAALKAEPNTTLLIAVETSDGQGALAVFIDLQLELGRSGLWSRASVLSRPDVNHVVSEKGISE